MEASAISLRDLLTPPQRQYRVPLFQRSYSWREEYLERLWEDLLELYEGNIDRPHFLGSIITQVIPEATTEHGITPFVIIDGQQRLITLTIILAILCKLIGKENLKASQELHNLYLINGNMTDNNKYKVLPANEDLSDYQRIVDDFYIFVFDDFKSSRKIARFDTLNTIQQAYNFFNQKLDTSSMTLDDRLKFKDIVLDDLVIVNIETDNKDNPYLIFESLNSPYMRQELTQADLVRNYILMRLSNEENQEKILSIERRIKRNLIERDLEAFLRHSNPFHDNMTQALHYYLKKDGDQVSEKEVYKKIKNEFEKDFDIRPKLEELIRFIKYYKILNSSALSLYRSTYLRLSDQVQNRRRIQNQEKIDIKYFLNRFRRLKFQTCQIFLLNVYDQYDHQERINLEDFLEILKYLESYFVRRLICGMSTQNMGLIVGKLYKDAQKANPNSLLNGMYTVLNSNIGDSRWPDDQEFRQGIINRPIYKPKGKHNDRVKLILESLETTLSKEQVNFKNLTIEHIMPQTITDEWKEMLGNNFKDTHKKWLHTLGNLTLTGYNSKLSNKPFDEKLEYFKDSNISLNKYFFHDNISRWNADEIARRAAHLADIAVKVWPR